MSSYSTVKEPQLEFKMGWGWFVFEQFNQSKRPWAGHNGAIKGFSSLLCHFIQEETTVIMLWNRDSFDRPDLVARPVITTALD